MKWQTAPVGRPAIQNLAGAAQGQLALFFSSSGFTKGAIEWAQEVSIQLYQFDLWGNVRPVMSAAAGYNTTFVPDDPEQCDGVTRLDEKIFAMSALSARVLETINRNARRDLSWGERRNLAAATAVAGRCASRLTKTEVLYTRGSWRRAEKLVDAVTGQMAKAASILSSRGPDSRRVPLCRATGAAPRAPADGL